MTATLQDFPPAETPALSSPPWKFWAGELLKSSPDQPLALDCESTVVDLNREIPQLVLASASDGQQTVIIRPEDLAIFLSIHEAEQFVFHNVAFDFWVIDQYLKSEKSRSHTELDFRRNTWGMTSSAESAWWIAAEDGRLHDTMLLDMLVRLAKGEGETPNAEDGGKFYRRSLAQLAKKYQATYSFTEKEKGKKKSKKSEEEDPDDPIRKRYHELLSISDWSTADPSFFTYAAKDVYTTWEIYPRLVREATSLLQPFKGDPGIFPDSVERYGLLTEKIQVLGAIALAQVGRNGIHIDRTAATSLEEKIRTQAAEGLSYIQTHHEDILNIKVYKKTGERKIIYTPKSNTFSLKHKKLQETLIRICEEKSLPVILSKGVKKNNVSVSWTAWSEHQEIHPFLKAWVSSSQLVKLIEFFALFRESDVLHCRYNSLVRTGRTSAEDRIQQIPRDKDFRALFIPRPGYKFVIADYAGIELRTLAAILLKKFGKDRAKLAEVFQRPPPYDDAHSYTASLMLEEPFEHVLAHKKEPKYAQARQAAKALNFGIPGGLGAEKLVTYAKANYNVTLTLKEAKAFREKVVNEIYSELNAHDGWLMSSHLSNFSLNLGIPQPELEAFILSEVQGLPLDLTLHCLYFTLYGHPIRANGTPYSPNWVRTLWSLADDLLKKATKPVPPEIELAVHSRQGSGKLSMFFSSSAAVTLTGRIRSNLTYTESKNSPFQGLAADGMKLALWKTIKEGYRVVAMIHDELIVEVPEATAEKDHTRLVEIMKETMSDVISNLVPISLESHVGSCWSK